MTLEKQLEFKFMEDMRKEEERALKEEEKCDLIATAIPGIIGVVATLGGIIINYSGIVEKAPVLQSWFESYTQLGFPYF